MYETTLNFNGNSEFLYPLNRFFLMLFEVVHRCFSSLFSVVEMICHICHCYDDEIDNNN